MKKIIILLFSMCATHIYAQDVQISGIKINQSEQALNAAFSKKFVKMENGFNGTFAGFSNCQFNLQGYKGWIDIVRVHIPTDGTFDNAKLIVESLISAFENKYGAGKYYFVTESFNSNFQSMKMDDILIGVGIEDDNSVLINYKVMRRNVGISNDDI